MAYKKKQDGRGRKMGPRQDEGNSNVSWSRDTGSESIPDPPDATGDRVAQMQHGDGSAGIERTTEKPATADFFEPLGAKRGEDARRAEGE